MGRGTECGVRRATGRRRHRDERDGRIGQLCGRDGAVSTRAAAGVELLAHTRLHLWALRRAQVGRCGRRSGAGRTAHQPLPHCVTYELFGESGLARRRLVLT